MAWTIIFYLFMLGLLLVMAYWLWGGVGRRRPAIGRGFAVVALALAGYVAALIYDLVT